MLFVRHVGSKLARPNRLAGAMPVLAFVFSLKQPTSRRFSTYLQRRMALKVVFAKEKKSVVERFSFLHHSLFALLM
jgi:hypothetical protein